MVERRSALEGAARPGDFGTPAAGGPGVILGERRSLAIVQVAALGERDAAVRGGIAAGCGVAPAAEASRAARGGGTAVLWSGPGRWLVVAAEQPGSDLAARLEAALATAPAVVTDLGHARTVLRVSGPSARDLLAKGCPLDLHPRTFPVDACAHSLLGHAGILIHAVDAVPSFDLYLARSYARSAWEWIEESAAEYGCRVVAPADLTGSG
ncbi:MAG TPA: sarcosine oxidase subunit gamma family protein [Stellaceae bacterium]|nr:sarcosine oxidase subunit gamma family protein [Stellaceae bacterium]